MTEKNTMVKYLSEIIDIFPTEAAFKKADKTATKIFGTDPSIEQINAVLVYGDKSSLLVGVIK